MTEELRNDLLAIVLEEAFGMREHYAKLLIGGGIEGRFRKADDDAMEAANHIVDRFEARCSKIVG